MPYPLIQLYDMYFLHLTVCYACHLTQWRVFKYSTVDIIKGNYDIHAAHVHVACAHCEG